MPNPGRSLRMLRRPSDPRSTVPRLSPPVAFAVVAATFVWFLAASSAPSPLYVVYQETFAFSEFTLTTVFAVYVLALIAALLVAGSLSDHIGRKPVLLGAIGLEAVSLMLFLLADGVGWLLVARVVQGSRPARRRRRCPRRWSISQPAVTGPSAPAWSTAPRRSPVSPSGRWAAVCSSSTRPRRPAWSGRCCWPAWSWPPCWSP